MRLPAARTISAWKQRSAAAKAARSPAAACSRCSASSSSSRSISGCGLAPARPWHRVLLHQQPGLHHVRDLLRGDRQHQGALLRVELEQPLRLQPQQRLPHGGARHPDGLGEVAFGEQRAALVAAVQHPGLDVQVDPLGGGGRLGGRGGGGTAGEGCIHDVRIIDTTAGPAGTPSAIRTVRGRGTREVSLSVEDRQASRSVRAYGVDDVPNLEATRARGEDQRRPEPAVDARAAADGSGGRHRSPASAAPGRATWRGRRLSSGRPSHGPARSTVPSACP